MIEEGIIFVNYSIFIYFCAIYVCNIFRPHSPSYLMIVPVAETYRVYKSYINISSCLADI